MAIYVGGILLLIISYFTWAKFLEKMMGINYDRPTPAYTMTDGVDYIPMSTWRVYLIQLLNIAGLGPIFGALQGALWGPAAYLWIIFGCIFGGAVHDFVSGVISLKHKGASLSELHGIYLGKTIQNIMRIFIVIMLVLVGVVFVKGPADLLNLMVTKQGIHINYYFWISVIFSYYLLATMLPIDKIIGKIYPLFGLALLIMVFGVGIGIAAEGYKIPAFTLQNLHPKGIPIWSTMFITIACGALSGFHATQSPMMARCLKTEKHARLVFYGAMASEGLIAMVWATVGMAFYKGGTPELAAALANGGPNAVVYNSCVTLMGVFGGILAVLGVIACPITTGDTAFRAARLMLAEILNVDQKPILRRFYLAITLFAVAIALTFIDFGLLWKYFAWSNQVLGTVTLWACSVFLYKYKGQYHWITTLPALFMTGVTTSFILTQPIGFNLDPNTGNWINLVWMVLLLGLFLIWGTQHAKRIPVVELEKTEDK
jgi:carbon starvation protein CstA